MTNEALWLRPPAHPMDSEVWTPSAFPCCAERGRDRSSMAALRRWPSGQGRVRTVQWRRLPWLCGQIGGPNLAPGAGPEGLVERIGTLALANRQIACCPPKPDPMGRRPLWTGPVRKGTVGGSGRPAPIHLSLSQGQTSGEIRHRILTHSGQRLPTPYGR